VIRLSIVALWLGLGIWVLRNLRSLWRQKVAICLSTTSFLTGIGILSYGSSWFFDKSIVPVAADLSLLWEELLQLNGTIFLFAASLNTIDLRR
jgi:hypothetical protein